MSKTLIAYYSWSGTTKKLAEKIAKDYDADLYEITVSAKTFSSDMYETNDIFKSQIENKDWPKVSVPDNYNNYEILLLGTPVWSGMPASPLVSFLEQIQDFNGKIYVFHTSVGQFGKEFDDTLNKWAKSLNILDSAEGDKKINQWLN